MITGFLLPEKKMFCGVDVGNNAVKAKLNGRIVKRVPGRRGEMVLVGKFRWFKMEYRQGKAVASTAYGKNYGRVVISETDGHSRFRETEPTYRKYGEVDISSPDSGLRMGDLFYPDIVGTIEYIHLKGYLSPGWFEENRKKMGL